MATYEKCEQIQTEMETNKEFLDLVELGGACLSAFAHWLNNKSWEVAEGERANELGQT